MDKQGGDKISAEIGDNVTNAAIGKDIQQAYTGNIAGSFVQAWDNAQVVIQQTLSEADIQDQKNRRTLRQAVRKFWIEDVLARSLNYEVAIRLNLADHSNLVENRLWKLIPQESSETTKLLPSETHIVDVFDQMNQRLLILGEPGAGKTTLVLVLADTLLRRADETPTEPSPVVFNLSSWVQRQLPLREWLVDELSIRYTIPKKMAQAWIEHNKLLPLLDGLDEVKLEDREACVQAINDFLQEHLVPLVVCSRTVEYEQLTVRLNLQGAVLLQPLTTDQINTYLDRAGPSLETVRITLQHDTELQELVHSPLLLSIMTLAYQGVDAPDLSLTNATQTRREHLFNTYIHRMFVRREVDPIYSPLQTVRWLQWLATRLVQSGQTSFLIERMQPSWLQVNGQRPFLIPLIMLLAGPIYGLTNGLLGGLLIGLIYELHDGITYTMLDGRLVLRIGGLLDGLIYGLLVGLLVGLIYGLLDGLSGRYRQINSIEQSSIFRKKLKSSLYAMLFWSLISGLLVGLLNGLIGGLLSVRVNGLIYGLIGGLLFGLIGGLSGALLGMFREIEPVKRQNWSWQRIGRNRNFGQISGLLVGLLSGLIDGLLFGLRYEPLFGLLGGLLSGLLVGLSGGLLSNLIFQPATVADVPIRIETKTSNQGIRLSARYSFITSIIFGLLGGLLSGLLVGLIVGLITDPLNGLLFGLFVGLLFGLLSGLTGGLVAGGDVVTKHCILRVALWWQGHIPWNYSQFLDYATALIFLRKVGGGYIFVHRLIMEHFAAMTDKDMDRLVKGAK